jgi:ATP-dependent DNA helicase RecQ
VSAATDRYDDPYADVPWDVDELTPPDDADAPPPPEYDGYAGALARATRDAAPAANRPPPHPPARPRRDAAALDPKAS